MTDTITLPRSVVEQALEALKIGRESAHDCAETFHIEMAGYKQQRHEALDAEVKQISDAIGVLRAALEQPQDHPEQHLDMVPEGWKMVPAKPTEDMLNAVAWPGCAATDWEHMLAAAPQPPTAEKSSGVEQPQGEQEPVAWIEHEWSGSGLRHLHFERPAPTVRDEVVRPVWTPLYTHPQPKREPLTEMEINTIWRNSTHRTTVEVVRAIEAAHGIGGEA